MTGRESARGRKSKNDRPRGERVVLESEPQEKPDLRLCGCPCVFVSYYGRERAGAGTGERGEGKAGGLDGGPDSRPDTGLLRIRDIIRTDSGRVRGSGAAGWRGGGGWSKSAGDPPGSALFFINTSAAVRAAEKNFRRPAVAPGARYRSELGLWLLRALALVVRDLRAGRSGYAPEWKPVAAGWHSAPAEAGTIWDRSRPAVGYYNSLGLSYPGLSGVLSGSG